MHSNVAGREADGGSQITTSKLQSLIAHTTESVTGTIANSPEVEDSVPRVLLSKQYGDRASLYRNQITLSDAPFTENRKSDAGETKYDSVKEPPRYPV